MTATATETEVRYCDAIIFRATLESPEEYCEGEAADGSDYCIRHCDPDDYDDQDPQWDDDWADDEHYGWGE